jgi:acyl-CoA synthetase (NDP forming)
MNGGFIMAKLYKDFFKDKDILFVGYSSRNNAYSREIYQALTNNQFKVYPYNKKENATYDLKVYKKLEELPAMPKNAFVLLNKNNTTAAVKELIGKGVKRILFRSAGNVDPAALAECEKAGVETAFGCPLMLYGTGFHKFHAFLAGVK